jgi:hypothetical protein
MGFCIVLFFSSTTRFFLSKSLGFKTGELQLLFMLQRHQSCFLSSPLRLDLCML